MTKTSDQVTTIVMGCLLVILLAAIMSIFTGWLLTIVVGYFGFHLTLWQGIVTAFTVKMITGAISTSTK